MENIETYFLLQLMMWKFGENSEFEQSALKSRLLRSQGSITLRACYTLQNT